MGASATMGDMEPLIVAGAKSMVSALTRRTVKDVKDEKLGSAVEAEVYKVAQDAWGKATAMVSGDRSVNFDELGILVANALGLDGAGEGLLISTFDDSRPFDFADYPAAAEKLENIDADHLGVDPWELFRAFRIECAVSVMKQRPTLAANLQTSELQVASKQLKC